jgi:hypothetical protein
MNNIIYRVNKLLWGTDMLATRFTLSVAAILTSFMLFANPGYWVDAIIGPYVAASLFLFQGLASGKTLLFGLQNKLSMLHADGILGCLLWSYVCITNLSYEAWHYSDAAHISLALASWWALVRWGSKNDGD